ncbi:MAG: hypothetical protein ACFHW5_18495 [Verrucomicrobiota bacterium]
MSGFKRQNQTTQGVLLFTLVLDGKKIDREYIITKLNSRKITHVRRTLMDDPSTPLDLSQENPKNLVNVAHWLHAMRKDAPSNYIWLIYFITIFCSYRWPDRKKKRYEEFVNIPATVWESHITVRAIPIILNILQAAEVLMRNHRYLSAAAAQKVKKEPFSKSLAIFQSPKVRYSSITSVSLPELDTVNVFHNDNWLKAKAELPITGDLNTSEVIKTNLSKLRLDPDVLTDVDAYDYAKDPKIVSQGADPNRAKEWDKMFLTKILTFASPDLKPSEVESWNLTCTYHEHTGRCYHSFSNFPSRWRHKLKVKGAHIWNIDASACHPFLMIKLYELSHHPPSMVALERKNYKKRFSHNSDFYLTVGALGGIERTTPDQSDIEYRNMIKQEVRTFMNARNSVQRTTQLDRAYRRKFPVLVETMDRVKTSLMVDRDSSTIKKMEERARKSNSKGSDKVHTWKDFLYLQMSYFTSLWEGELIIKKVCHQLAHEPVIIDGKPYKPFFFPLHDAIITTRNFVRPIKKLLKSTFVDECGATPPFKEEKLAKE